MTAGVVADAPVARLASLPGVSTATGVAKAAEHAQATGGVLPVLPELAGLFPTTGLRRGSTVAVLGSTSLLFALLAGATANGAWAAVVGVPALGLVAASEFGVDVARLALVPKPGADFAAVTAALLDGIEVVAVGGKSVNPQVARRLSARARHRGAVLLSFGGWPGAELELRCEPGEWAGLKRGGGRLRARDVVVRTRGRGAFSRPQHEKLLLPGPVGTVARVETVVPLRALEVG